MGLKQHYGREIGDESGHFIFNFPPYFFLEIAGSFFVMRVS